MRTTYNSHRYISADSPLMLSALQWRASRNQLRFDGALLDGQDRRGTSLVVPLLKIRVLVHMVGSPVGSAHPDGRYMSVPWIRYRNGHALPLADFARSC